MKYTQHILFYLCIGIILVLVLHAYYTVSFITFLAFAVGGIYSILPDVDSHASKIRKHITRVILGTVFISLCYFILYEDSTMIYTSLGFIGFLFVLQFAKHRGFFHSLGGLVLMVLPLFLLSFEVGVFAFLGYLSHLIGDLKNGMG